MSKKETKKYQIYIDWSVDYPILTERDVKEMFEGTGVEFNYDSLKFYRRNPFQYIINGKADDEIRKKACAQIRGIKFVELFKNS